MRKGQFEQPRVCKGMKWSDGRACVPLWDKEEFIGENSLKTSFHFFKLRNPSIVHELPRWIRSTKSSVTKLQFRHEYTEGFKPTMIFPVRPRVAVVL